MRLVDADALETVITQLNENGWEITRGEYKLIDNVLFEMPTIEPEPCKDAVKREDVQSIAEKSDWFESSDSFNDFIWALYELPSAQADSKELSFTRNALDTISRQAVIEINRSYHGQMPNEVNHRIWKEINELPSAQPERKKGKWLPDNNSVYEMRFVCSECKESQVVPTIGFTKYKPIWDFCPYCGARMEGE